MKVSQTQHANALIHDMRALDARARQILQSADRDALDWAPPRGAWSVGQVFEHLCAANDDYLVAVRAIVAKLPASSEPATDLTWRPSFVGGMLAKSMTSPRKMPAPKSWKPGPHPRPNVIEEFLARQGEIVRLIERSMAHDWRRLRLASPVSSFIRMNLGDAFTILVRHAERHFGQIDARLAAYESGRSDRLAATR